MKKFTSSCIGRRLTVLSACLACAAVLATVVVRADSVAPPPAAAVNGPSTGKGTVLKDKINIRSRPVTSAEVVTQANKGDTLEVLDRKTIQENRKPMEWLHVVLPESAKCYINSKLLKNGEISSVTVNVRCGPGSNYKEIGKLAKGDKVNVIGTHGEWSQVKPTAHCTGWIAAEYVDVAAPPPAPAAGTPIIVTPPVSAMPEATMPAAGIQPAVPEDEVRSQYLLRDGIFESVKDEPNPPAPYQLRTEDIAGRSYRIAYLEVTEKNLARYEGKHVKVFGNERWHKSDRYPVIAVEHIDMVW